MNLWRMCSERLNARLWCFLRHALAVFLLCLPNGLHGQEPAENGRKSIAAVFTDSKITIDGELDEPAWQSAQPAKDFIQRDPNTGEPASEPTEVRILYDRQNLYIGVYCHDSSPERIIVNNIRRDFPPNDQDTFAFLLDTFHDRRSGYTFSTTPRG
ncbi:MAG TPA: carbohydrate binding family 9 domain-containing protein, partial [Terriglobia bacterium]